MTSIPVLQHSSLKDWLAAVEEQMVSTLADCLAKAIVQLEQVNMPKLLQQAKEKGGEKADENLRDHPFLKWIAGFPLQALILALQVSWTKSVEESLKAGGEAGGVDTAAGVGEESAVDRSNHPLYTGVLNYIVDLLGFLADKVVMDVGLTVRQRMVQVITELVHQRDVCR